MALKGIVKLTKTQMDSLRNGTAVGSESSIDPEKLYFVEKTGFENVVELGSNTLPSSTSTTKTISLSSPYTDFDFIVVLAATSSSGTYGISCVPTAMCSTLDNSNRIVIKTTQNYFASFWFTDASTAKATANNAAGNIIFYGVNI